MSCLTVNDDLPNGESKHCNVKESHFNKILLLKKEQNICNFAHFKISVQMPLF